MHLLFVLFCRRDCYHRVLTTLIDISYALCVFDYGHPILWVTIIKYAQCIYNSKYIKSYSHNKTARTTYWSSQKKIFSYYVNPQNRVNIIWKKYAGQQW